MTESGLKPFATPEEYPIQRIVATDPATLVLPVIEEQAIIEREIVESGRVRIRKTVQQVPQLVETTLQHDEVQVERVAVNQFVADDAPLPESRQQGDTLIVPILREVVVTRVLLVEELHIRKQVVEELHQSTVQLRHEQIRVERDPPVSTDQ